MAHAIKLQAAYIKEHSNDADMKKVKKAKSLLNEAFALLENDDDDDKRKRPDDEETKEVSDNHISECDQI